MKQDKKQRLLLCNVDRIVTMDDDGLEIENGSILIQDGFIEKISPNDQLVETKVADKIIDLRGHIVIPGLINTHHHMYQSLTRSVPRAQNAELFHWLKTLYPIWAGITPEMIRISSLVAMAELILSGCTTSSDHLYLYPNGCRLDDSIEAAAEIGLRFHPTRGSMSVGESLGGLPPDHLVEAETHILKDCQRAIEEFHDPGYGSMLRVGLAPCSPFSVSRELMRESARMARSYDVNLHTHLAENDHDIAYSKEKFNMTPAEYAEDLEWLGNDVWHAHCVKLDKVGIDLFHRTGTSVAHCPCSNMRLASGTAPVKEMIKKGVNVSLGVDGSASNDSGHLLNEARQMMLLQRASKGPDAISAKQVLEAATRGGAKSLNRSDIGILSAGMSADLVAYDMNTLAFAGGLSDPIAALVFCGPHQVSLSVINGKIVVKQGQLTNVDLPTVVERHNRFSMELLQRSL